LLHVIVARSGVFLNTMIDQIEARIDQLAAQQE
jgi:hypothetical protein